MFVPDDIAKTLTEMHRTGQSIVGHLELRIFQPSLIAETPYSVFALATIPHDVSKAQIVDHRNFSDEDWKKMRSQHTQTLQLWEIKRLASAFDLSWPDPNIWRNTDVSSS
jgi:hypothetical protein